MSTDVAVLSALAQVTGQELRYFEMVTLRFGGKRRRVYLCIGKHAFFLVKRDVSAVIQGGELFYAYLDMVVVDTLSKSDLLLVLNGNRPAQDSVWVSPNLFVLSNNRVTLVQHLKCCWTVDYMWRYGLVATFPKREAALSAAEAGGKGGVLEHEVMPFVGFRRQDYACYSFFLRESFVEQPHVLSTTDTGHYADPERPGCEIIIHVHDPVLISLLNARGREHVRWVALEYKQMLTKEVDQYYVLRNRSYLKKMNLAEDVAMWVGWEMLIKTQKHILVVIVLRRMYCPPLGCTVQDIVIMFKSTNHEAVAIAKHKENGDSKMKQTWVSDAELVQEGQLVADSFAPAADEFPIYRDIVQGKLDALRFDEDGYRFLENHYKLLPKARAFGKSFLKSILVLLSQDGMLANAEEMLGDSMCALGKKENEDPWQTVRTRENPLLIAEEMVENAEGLEEASGGGTQRNKWNKRVAGYLSYCIDGGLCRQFTIYDLIDAKAGLTAESQKKLGRVIDYLLHLRPKDMSRRYFDVSIVAQLQETLDGWEFNERVMQILLESDYIRKLFGRSREREYAQCVSNLLANPSVSISLKSSLCRQIVGTPPAPEIAGILAPALVDVLKKSKSYYVQTCVCTALVVMSADSEEMKTLLMACGVAPMMMEMVRSRDDDLVQYTLMLLVNLSKHTHHRGIFVNYGVLPTVADILSSSYHALQFKAKILLQLCSVIGQFSNDEDSRKILTQAPHNFTLDCLMYIFDECPPRGALEGKVLYAMRMCAQNSNDAKFRVGQHCYLKLIEELQDAADLGQCLDFVYNALCFFLVVSEVVENAAALQSVNIADTLQRIRDDLYDVSNVQEKTTLLLELLRKQTHRESF
ncbi:unnamed protein product [Amoebophrya sp. A25]|nr:unnamed protein product [Amoebophrya sp. A25]|eukprot:GSA25T00015121001.1